MTEADRLFHVATGPEVLNAPFVPCRWAWLAAALFGPLSAGVWFLVWRRIFPDASRLAHLRRSRAARRATDAIRRANRTSDPPATIANAVLAYLRTRFPLPESAVTPSEIERLWWKCRCRRRWRKQMRGRVPGVRPRAVRAAR